MKIVLTGHCGFIGSHYYNEIKETNHDVYVFDKLNGFDLCESSIVNDLPECDVVVHLAATNGTRLFYDTPTEVSFNNTLPTFNLIKRYKNTNTKFIFASTCEIFNGAIDQGLYSIPTDENVPIMFQNITNPRWSYSLPKALGENLVSNSGLEWLVLRYFNIYGPRQKDHFISEFVDRCKKGNYFIQGNDTRSFCYVTDAVKITNQLIHNCSNEIINVGKTEEVEISTVAKIILEILEIDPNKLEILPGPAGSAKRRCPDTKKMFRFIDYKFKYDLYKGLKNTVESLL